MFKQPGFPSLRLVAPRLGFVLVVSAGLLCVAQIAAGGGLKPSELRSRLLSGGQVPAGWTVSDAPGAGIGCPANLLESSGPKPTGLAQVEFDDHGAIPAVIERLATYRDASTGYRSAVARLNGCGRLSGSISGEPVAGTIRSAAFPHYGEESAFFDARFTIANEPVDDGILVERTDNVVMEIDEGGVAPVDRSQFEHFVSRAVRVIQ
jgi:hypothetical protein